MFWACAAGALDEREGSEDEQAAARAGRGQSFDDGFMSQSSLAAKEGA